jgi:mono/diheme cytochrome c family protein
LARWRQGWKRAATSGAQRLARGRPALAAIAVGLLVASGGIGVAVWSARPAFGVPPVAMDPAYASECGACHMPYPPSLAPGARWAALMDGLADHFGEDASLEPRVKAAILAWLSDNSAGRWDTRAAHEFARADPADPLRITATPYWAKAHRGVPAAVFKSKAVGAPGNCLACHADAMTGRFDPQWIQIPEQAL